MGLDGLLHSESSPSSLYEAIIVGTPDSVLDQLEVIIPAFSSSASIGPAPWTPRVDDDGLLVLPSDGDRCIVAYAETDHPGTPEAWIVGWWPSG